MLRAVEPVVFRQRFFTRCMECDFCHDWCCQFGVDVDRYHVDRILAHAPALERFVGVPRDAWFTGEVEPDPDVPGGESWRTAVRDGACVFLNRSGRGCLLHAFALAQGIDHHELKSLVDGLFPLSFDEGVLGVALEAQTGELVCLNTGPTLYQGMREELRYYFGDELVTALDLLERESMAA